MLVSAILGRAATLLQDLTKLRWSEAELLDWLNEGQREVVKLRHDASVSNASIILAANTTKQVLPIGAIALLNITRNMGIDGATPGAPVKKIEREWLDALVPGWSSEIGAVAIKNFCINPLDPKHFDVYPRPHATTVVQVEALLCVLPADCLAPTTNPAAVITLADEYASALLDYILFRAFSKDTEAADAQKAAGYLGMFMTGLGIKSKADTAAMPAVTKSGGV